MTTRRRPRSHTTSKLCRVGASRFALPFSTSFTNRRRALELYGAKAKLNFSEERGESAAPAAEPAAASAAAVPSDSEPDESEATPERIQRWIAKGLLILEPLPADDGSFVYIGAALGQDGAFQAERDGGSRSPPFVRSARTPGASSCSSALTHARSQMSLRAATRT